MIFAVGVGIFSGYAIFAPPLKALREQHEQQQQQSASSGQQTTK
eukprot:CAMPEP_0118963386 /NCGR_PEP_ID=MMETSP1173-20130426/1306_1 /TAXON_ID=1034831 /ORGANISM="Rhizochromulina marina cf, Strain CCMP1243" /LENGTH=43 /DNA_ID= /DNA_START= /DNA_END= /DNA_ORIENTATION=